MTENLHEILQDDHPVALRRIEKALQVDEVQNETVDAILSALIWRRCTSGENGALGAVINNECAARISVLADHLDYVGASDAAQAVRDLREEIPLDDNVIEHGIIDWVDSNPEIVRYAQKLNEEIDDIAPTVWNFMQERQDELPDPEIPEKKTGVFARLFGG